MSELSVGRDPHNPRRVALISPARGRRPHLFGAGECPFCPGSEHLTPRATLVAVDCGDEPCYTSELGGTLRGDWVVRVFPNMYPALRLDPGLRPPRRGLASAYGYHEVVVESRVHDELRYLEDSRNVRYALLALRERVRGILSDELVEAVVPVKNSGLGSGASVPHPHMQIFGLTFTPPELDAEVRSFAGGSCPICGLARDRSLVAFESSYVVVVASPAPRAPYEVLVAPKEHSPSYADASYEVLDDLSRVLGAILRYVLTGLGVGYNMWFHTAPKSAADFHWHIELVPLTSTWGGFEKGGGVFVVPTPPREVASELRRALSGLVS